MREQLGHTAITQSFAVEEGIKTNRAVSAITAGDQVNRTSVCVSGTEWGEYTGERQSNFLAKIPHTDITFANDGEFSMGGPFPCIASWRTRHGRLQCRSTVTISADCART